MRRSTLLPWARALGLLAMMLALPAQPVEAQGAVHDDAAASPADSEEARMHFDLARRYYDTGRFDDAAREFEAAYAMSPLPPLTYNLYLAYRDGGQDVQAARWLRRYLDSDAPQGATRSRLEARLQVLEERLRSSAAGDEAADPQTAPQADEPGETSLSPDDPPVATEDEPTGDGPGVAPWILVGAGGALIAAGAVTGLMALGESSDLDDLCPTRDTCSAGFEDAASRGETLAVVTDVLWISGAAAAVTGVLWALLAGDDDQESTPRAGLACDDTGCIATLRGAL